MDSIPAPSGNQRELDGRSPYQANTPSVSSWEVYYLIFEVIDTRINNITALLPLGMIELDKKPITIRRI
jgi:hypothetical protein